MKKKSILTAPILVLTFAAGCGKTDEKRAQYPEVEIIDEEPISSEASEGGASDNIQAEEGNKEQSEEGNAGRQDETDGTGLSFGDVADRTFYFSSGAGAWWTELRINSDGSFNGIYQDADMGNTVEDYPNGTLYYCEFSGIFDRLEQVDDYTYKMRLASIEYEKEPSKEEIIDGVRNIYSIAYGLDGGEEFYLYLPGIELTALPESYLGWIGYYNLESAGETKLPYYGLYNVSTGDGFSSHVYEEQSLADSIAMEISIANERSKELETELISSITQTDMNETAKEIFQTWDDALNIVWNLLESNLSEEEMETLRAEEREWITYKEAEELNKERVYELADLPAIQ